LLSHLEHIEEKDWIYSLVYPLRILVYDSSLYRYRMLVIQLSSLIVDYLYSDNNHYGTIIFFAL